MVRQYAGDLGAAAAGLVLLGRVGRRPDVNLRVVLELLRVVEDDAAVVGADGGELAVLDKVGGGDELRRALDLVPQRHLLVWNVPEPELAVERAAQEVPVVLEDARGSKKVIPFRIHITHHVFSVMDYGCVDRKQFDTLRGDMDVI